MLNINQPKSAPDRTVDALSESDELKQKQLMKLLLQITPSPTIPTNMSEDEKIATIAEHFEAIMRTLGLDLENDSLKLTPQRVARMYVREIFSGLSLRNFPKVTVIENAMNYIQPVIVKGISAVSTCEHHFVTINGLASVGYVPKGKIIGLSKINRIVKFFAQQPQVQERMTKQIADALELILETADVAVKIEADHFCVHQRGIEDRKSSTITIDVRGQFKERLEFFQML